MRLIDLHCDTLYKAVTQNIGLDDSNMEVAINSYNSDSHITQCFAIWLPDDLNEESAEQLFFKSAHYLKDEGNRLGIKLISKADKIKTSFNNNRFSACFTVENGSALNGKIENIKRFSDLGVRMMTLTWNGHNSLGDGADVQNSKGLTEFGKIAVGEMEANNIVVDISHASDKLFYDVAEIATRPFVASHSNSRVVTNHRRNLTDEQFKIIANIGGIVGLNFHKDFLSSDSDCASMNDILKHCEHFISLGGENVVAIGSDFDGCTLPNDILGSRSLSELYELFLRKNYKESQIRKIFYENALNFFENFDNEQIM